jgi:hypothetical protein
MAIVDVGQSVCHKLSITKEPRLPVQIHGLLIAVTRQTTKILF